MARPAGTLLGLLLLAVPARAEAPLTPEAALALMAQENCLDAAGATIAGLLPFAPGCARRAAATEGGTLAYRKHDWPGAGLAAALPRGYQASDAYRTTIQGLPAVVQSFDYGTPPYTFGQWDGGTDGGDGVVLDGPRLAIALTEDPVGGAQWWNSERCDGRAPIKPGWLLWQPGPPAAVAPNYLTRSPAECRRGRTLSLTLWQEGPLTLPWLRLGVPQGDFTAPGLISEHYTHPEARLSNAMERFYFAAGLGKVRWERWENLAFPRGRTDQAQVERDAATLAAAATCPDPGALASPDRLGGQWRLTFCRMWTNLEPAPPGRPFPVLPWPVAAANR
jgi:hypothetical protein